MNSKSFSHLVELIGWRNRFTVEFWNPDFRALHRLCSTLAVWRVSRSEPASFIRSVRLRNKRILTHRVLMLCFDRAHCTVERAADIDTSAMLCSCGFCILSALGRHCNSHQMTGNYMWDQSSQKEFLIGTNDDSRLPLWWDGSEPLWVTLQKLGKKVFMYYWPGECSPGNRVGWWVIQSNSCVISVKREGGWLWCPAEDASITVHVLGCEVEILGVRPAFCKEYIYNPTEENLSESITQALDVLRWVQLFSDLGTKQDVCSVHESL